MCKKFFSVMLALIMVFSTVFCTTAFAETVDSPSESWPEGISQEEVEEVLGCSIFDYPMSTIYATVYEPNQGSSTYVIEVPANNQSVTVDNIDINQPLTKGQDFQVMGDRMAWFLGAIDFPTWAPASTVVTGYLYANNVGIQKTLAVGNAETKNTGFFNCTPRTTFHVEYSIPSGISCRVFSLVVSYNS